LHCLPDKGSAQPNYNIHQGHKIHLLDEINSKIDEDINALDERIKNLMKIIEGEIGKKKEDIENLKKFDVEIKAKLKEIYEKENETIRQGELIRTKELAALVNEILRINDENIRRVNFLNKLFDNRSMTEYLTNFHIYKNKYVSETAKNLYILEKRVAAYMEKYKKNKYTP
jgi:seryl-tRNA synthetase